MAHNADLNNLLKWSIENTKPADPSSEATNTTTQPHQPVDTSVLDAIFGGPSDADLMRESMAAIQSSKLSLEEKLLAFDNFEQLVESLDNANNLAPLGLWPPLLVQLEHSNAEIRNMAAWCVGTAVQNNIQAQEHALAGGAVPSLLRMFGEEEQANRRKARYAISSLVRNYQPGMNAVLKELNGGSERQVDASDMEGVDRLLEELMSTGQ